ncbi:MAG: tyrosine-type recombinase/integrase [Chloroflexota bacterium]|nr:tyrosine-type recombinase/integrase [Chloroflexota bacterium]
MTPTELSSLMSGYSLCAQTEGKSKNTVTIVTRSVTYFNDFLSVNGLSTDVTQIGTREIRTFIFHLQQKRCFSNHPYSKAQRRGLSGHTINTYMRSIRAFWSWLVEEEIIEVNPFSRLKIPKPPKKVIATFSQYQIESLLSIMNNSPEGYRDMVIILTLLDTGLRVNELINLKMEHVWLEESIIKVLGKGNKERLVPIGKQIRKLLWRYISQYRPEPALPNLDNLFLNRDGRPLTKNRLDSLMKHYGKLAGLTGIRCSPHTLRHTFAINYLRNGGDVFSLQKILGHSSLEMTRRYCELADVDMRRAHAIASPVDNLKIGRKSVLVRGTKGKKIKMRQEKANCQQ